MTLSGAAQSPVAAPAAAQAGAAAAPAVVHGGAPLGPGGLAGMRALARLRRAPLQALMEARRRHGDVAPLGRMGGRGVLLVSHPELIHEVLVGGAARFGKGRSPGSLDLLAPEPMALLDGAPWAARRRIVAPVFRARALDHYLPLMWRATQGMLERWARLAPGATLDIGAEMARLTLEVILQALFTCDAAAEGHALGAAIGDALNFVGARLWAPVKLPLRLPTPAHRRFLRARRRIDALVADLVGRRRRAARLGDDMLGRLLAARDEASGVGLTDAQVRDEVVSFFIAGHETTATALTWFWCLMSQHPTARRRVVAEAESLAGPDSEALAQLHDTRQSLEETLRLYPPGWAISRQALRDAQIGGLAVPRGTLVMLSPYVTHRRDDLWENPEGFDPMRFAPTAPRRPMFAYFPFGGGPYSCVAGHFALAEAQLIAAAIGRRFRLDLLPGQTPTPHASFTLRPRRPIWMRLHQLRGAAAR